MDNMQLLHECRDSQDDHFEERRRKAWTKTDTDCTRQHQVNDDFNGEGDIQDEILDHLDTIENQRSQHAEHQERNVKECLKALKASGLFNHQPLDMNSDENLDVEDGYEDAGEADPVQERVWEKTYDQRRSD